MNREYHQVSNIRFLSMLGIVAIHSYLLDPGRAAITDDLVKLFGTQFFKFGTLCFFMVSGFLIGDRLNCYAPAEFLRRRISSVGKPWLFWSSVFFAMILVNAVRKGLVDVPHLIATVLFHSEYWFVPNFILALAVLVLFGKHIQNLYSGLLLFSVSVFYAVNIYLQIFPSEHTMSLFGYVFYLWFGMQLAIGKLPAIQKISGTRTSTLLFLAVMAYGASVLEAVLVSRYGQSEALNTLRLTNQFYGIIIFLLLFRIKRPIFPYFTNPTSDTFGIYLIQWIVIYIYSAIALHFLGLVSGVGKMTLISHYLNFMPWYSRILWWIVSFIIVYMTSLEITKAIALTRFYWLVGKEKIRKTQPQIVKHDLKFK